MNKISDIWKIFISYMLVIILVLFCGGAFGQSTKFCSQEICVVEFNAGWNKANGVKWLDDLENCGVTRILITNANMLADVKKRYNITNVPTIIIFNGKEIERFQACLQFKLAVRKKDVQRIINNAL